MTGLAVGDNDDDEFVCDDDRFCSTIVLLLLARLRCNCFKCIDEAAVIRSVDGRCVSWCWVVVGLLFVPRWN